MKPIDNNAPVNIDIEYIRSIKKDDPYRAKLLIKAYHKDKNNQKKQAIKEMVNKDLRILKHLKICVQCRKPVDNPEHVRCNACLIKKKQYAKNKR